MAAIQILDTLYALDDELVAWIVELSPKTDADRANLKALFARHREIERQINALVARKLELAVAALPDDVARLEEAKEKLETLSKDIAQVEQVLDTAGTVVTVCAKVISALA
jgi:hypothetical protein